MNLQDFYRTQSRLCTTREIRFRKSAPHEDIPGRGFHRFHHFDGCTFEETHGRNIDFRS
jgi:hypothetical protein